MDNSCIRYYFETFEGAILPHLVHWRAIVWYAPQHLEKDAVMIVFTDFMEGLIRWV